MVLWTHKRRMPWMHPPHRRVIKAAGDDAEIQRLLAMQTNVSTQLQQDFLNAIERVRDKIDTQIVVQYLQNNDVSGAIEYVNSQLTASSFQPFASAVSQAAIAAGIDAADNHPVLGATEYNFGVVNPQTVTNLATYDFGLITNISDEARASVAQVIRDGVAEGRNPLDIATDVRDYIGLLPRQRQAVENYLSELESGKSSALDRALRDRRFDSTVERAINGEDVLSTDQIENMVGRYTERQLASRAQTIARTEGMRAISRGNQEAWQQAVADGTIDGDRVRRFWYHSHDTKVRDSHLDIPDLNPDGVGLDEPFETPLGELMYPQDPDGEAADTINCRCCLIYRYVTPGIDLPDEYGLSL